jgi:hypothetical protein
VVLLHRQHGGNVYVRVCACRAQSSAPAHYPILVVRFAVSDTWGQCLFYWRIFAKFRPIQRIVFRKTDPNSPDFYDNFQQVANKIEGFCFFFL